MAGWWQNIFSKSQVAVDEIPHDILLYNNYRKSPEDAPLCYAPFRSLYFGQKGLVSACCFGRTYILGKIPEQTIAQIWQGPKAVELREALGKNDLSLGCQLCNEQIQGGNFSNVNALHFEQYAQNKKGYPALLEFELSNECNLECIMCQGLSSSLIRAKREKLPPLEMPYDDAFVNQLEEFIPYLSEAKFFGGEPFLVELYLKIWERIVAINPEVKIAVQTNGTVLNNRIKDVLEMGKFNIGVSIDAATSTTYESIRVNGKFDQLLGNMEYYKKYSLRKGTFFGLATCALQQNRYELAALVRLANSFNCDIYFNTVFYPRHTSLKFMGRKELQRLSETLGREILPEENEVQKKNKKHFENIVQQIKYWAAQPSESETGRYLWFANAGELWTYTMQQIEMDVKEKYPPLLLKEKIELLFKAAEARNLPHHIIRLERENKSDFEFMLYLIINDTPDQIIVRLERMYL